MQKICLKEDQNLKTKIGKDGISTSIMQISNSTDVPILIQSFKACSNLSDVLGAYNYRTYRKQSIRKSLDVFNKEINRKSVSSNFVEPSRLPLFSFKEYSI